MRSRSDNNAGRVRRPAIAQVRAIVLTAAALCCSGTPAVAASGPDPNTATYGSGTGALAFITVNPAVLRAEGQIPDRWKLALDSAGQATLFLDMQSSPITFDGETRQVTYAQLDALLDSTALPEPERQHDTSNFEGSPEDFYVIAFSVDDRGYAQWLGSGPGLGDIVRYVPNLSFNLGSRPLSSFSFAAADPSPTPFQFSATLTPGFFPVTPAIADYWRETPAGTLMIEDRSVGTDLLEQVVSWHLRTDPSSPLGQLIGGGQRDFTCGPTTAPAPVLGVVSHQNNAGCIGGETYNDVVWHKQIAVPASTASTTRMPATTGRCARFFAGEASESRRTERRESRREQRHEQSLRRHCSRSGRQVRLP